MDPMTSLKLDHSNPLGALRQGQIESIALRKNRAIRIGPLDAEYVVLFCAREEAALHDVLAQIGRFRTFSVGLESLCQNAILTLLRNGLICLYDDPNNLYPIHPARARELILCEFWQMGNRDYDIYLALTDAGVKAFRNYSSLTHKHKHYLIDALTYGSCETGYPHGVFEAIVSGARGMSRSWRIHGRDGVSRFLASARAVLVTLTKACVRVLAISKR